MEDNKDVILYTSGENGDLKEIRLSNEEISVYLKNEEVRAYIKELIALRELINESYTPLVAGLNITEKSSKNL